MGGNQKDQRVRPAEGQTRPPEASEAPKLGQRKADLGMEMREQQAERLVRERREAMALLGIDLEGDLDGQKENIEDFKKVIPSILGALIVKGALKLADIRNLGAFSSLDVQTTDEVQKKALQLLRTIADNQGGDVAGEIVKSWPTLLNDISGTVTASAGAISEITGRKPKDGLDKDIVRDTQNFMQKHPLITLGLAAAGVYVGYKLITSIWDGIGEGESTTDKVWKWGTRAILIAGGILVAGQVLGIDAVRGWLKEKGLNVDENRIAKALILFSNFRVRDGMLALTEGADPKFNLHESIGKKAASEPYVVRMVGKTPYQDFMHRSPSQSVFSDMPVLGKLFSDTLDQEKRLRGLLQMNEGSLSRMKPAPKTVDDAFEFLEKQGLAGISGLNAQDLEEAQRLSEEKDQQVAVIERDKTLTEEQKVFYLKRIEEFRDKFDNIEDESRSYLDELERSLSLAMDKQFGDIPDSNDLAAMRKAVIEAVRSQSLATDAAMVEQIFAFLDDFEDTVDQSAGQKLTVEQVTALVDKIERFNSLYIALNIEGPTFERRHKAELQGDIEGTRFGEGTVAELQEKGQDALDWGEFGLKTYLGVPLKVEMDVKEGRLFSAAVIGVPSAYYAAKFIAGGRSVAGVAGRALLSPVVGPGEAVIRACELTVKSSPFVAGKLFDMNVGNAMKNFMSDNISFQEFEKVITKKTGRLEKLLRLGHKNPRIILTQYVEGAASGGTPFAADVIIQAINGKLPDAAKGDLIVNAVFKQKYKFLEGHLKGIMFNNQELYHRISDNTELQRFLLKHNRSKFIYRFMPRLTTGHPISGDIKLFREFTEAVLGDKTQTLLKTLDDGNLMKLLGKEPKIFGQLVTPEGKALIQSLNGNKEVMDALLKDRPFRKAFLASDHAKRLSLISEGYTSARARLLSEGVLKENRVGRAVRKASKALDSFRASIATSVEGAPTPRYERVVKGLEVTDVKVVDGKYRYEIGGEWVKPLDTQNPAKLSDVRAKFAAELQKKGISMDFQKFAAESKSLIYFPVLQKMIGTSAAVLMIYHLETATDKRKAVAETAAGLGSFLAGMKATDWAIGSKIGAPTTPGKLIARTVINVMGGIATSLGFSEPIGKIVEHYFKKVPGSHAASGEVIDIFEKMTTRSTVGMIAKSAVGEGMLKKLLVKGGLKGVTEVFEKKISSVFLKKIGEIAAKKGFVKILGMLGIKGAIAAGLFADDATLIGVVDDVVAVGLLAWSAYDIYELVTLVANAAAVQEEMDKRKTAEITSFKILDNKSRAALQEKLTPYGKTVDNAYELGEQVLFDLLRTLPETAVEIKRQGVPGREIWYLKESEAVGITLFNEKGEEVAKISDEDAEELDKALTEMDKSEEAKPEAPAEQGQKEAA